MTNLDNMFKTCDNCKYDGKATPCRICKDCDQWKSGEVKALPSCETCAWHYAPHKDVCAGCHGMEVWIPARRGNLP